MLDKIVLALMKFITKPLVLIGIFLGAIAYQHYQKKKAENPKGKEEF